MNQQFDEIVQYLRVQLAGRGDVIVGDKQVALVPRGEGLVIALSACDEDSLLIQTGSGLRIGVGIDHPTSADALAAPIIAIVDGRLVEHLPPTFTLDIGGGASLSTRQPDDATAVPQPAWGRSSSLRA
ncbi:hypothetical protein [uncultured Microbacterium sp.]|uniref:hypothetical protein n=1 Tax=uncultured Microbacterium sp. TaxID=191216 RepID=UPI00262C33E9|nr:hypothetical protein [uncultured Microbacterium sp.]